MKVGIVTVHDSSNLGSFLQALGMYEIVKQHGDEPVIIKTRSDFTTFCLYLGYNNSKPARSAKSFIRFFVSNVKSPKITWTRYCKYKTYKKDWIKFGVIASPKSFNSINADVLLLGSDEIWNANQPAFQNPYMYGINLNAKKKVAYAISAGNVSSDKLKQFPELINSIRHLDSIIYRDDHTKNILRECGITSDEKICDPTIQIDIRKYMKRQDDVKLPSEDYIAVYSYNVDENKKDFIKRFAKERELKIVAVSLPHDWVDEYINCSPLEFGAVLEKAKFVFTSTFHGTIFSSLYHTKFVSDAILPKVKDVLNTLELEDHALPDSCNYETFCDMLEADYDFTKMEERITFLRNQSFELYEKYVKGVN